MATSARDRPQRARQDQLESAVDPGPWTLDQLESAVDPGRWTLDPRHLDSAFAAA